MERPARQALTPRFGAYAQGVAILVALTGAMSFPHSAVGAAQDRMDETVVPVDDADVEAETILDLDAVVWCTVCCWLRAGRCDGDKSFQTSRTRRKLRSS